MALESFEDVAGVVGWCKSFPSFKKENNLHLRALIKTYRLR